MSFYRLDDDRILDDQERDRTRDGDDGAGMIAPHVADCLCPACAARQPVTDYEMAEAMIAYGGGFVSHLGAAWMVADEVNRGRIVTMWAPEVAEYRELARLKRAQVTG